RALARGASGQAGSGHECAGQGSARQYSASGCFVHSGYSPSAGAPGVSVCAKYRAAPAPPWDKYVLRVTSLTVISEPTSEHQTDHSYTSDRYTVESLKGWPDARGSPLPSSHQRASTSCRSIPLQRPQERRDTASTARESWADDYLSVG